MSKVKYRGHLAALTGVSEEAFEAGNVEGILKSIRQRHGREAEKAARAMLIALNGESILLLKGFKTVLKDGDVINFFPLCAGG
jgi:molybdopterin converting factor small subunit